MAGGGSSTTDIAGIQQSGVAILSSMQETLAKTVPTNSSGYLEDDALIQAGFVRVLGVSVLTGAAGDVKLHDCSAIANASASNPIYSVPIVAGFYPVNMVFHKGLVLIEGAGTAMCVLFYSRV